MDNKELRRSGLQILISEAGGVAQLAEKCGVSEKNLQHILRRAKMPGDKKPRDIGDRLARRLEVGMGKQQGWLDYGHAAVKVSDIADAQDLVADFLMLPNDDQAEVRLYVKARLAVLRLKK